jgi:hypothetical protein
MRNIFMSAICISALALAIGCSSGDDKDKKNDTTPDVTEDAGKTEDGGTPEDAGKTATDAGPTSTDDTSTAKDTTTAAKFTTCIDVADCVAKACLTNEKDCEKACLAQGTNAALTKSVPFLLCYQGANCDKKCEGSEEKDCFERCVVTSCTDPMMNCIDTGKSGEDVCASALDCFGGCDLSKDKPFTCFSQCYNKLSKESKPLLGKFMNCMGKAGDKGMAACGDEMIACTSGGKTGDKGCGFGIKCMDECDTGADKTDGCIAKCLPQMTSEAQKLFFGINTCEQQPTPKAQNDCMQQKVMTCMLDGLSGEKMCLDGFDCMEKCNAPSSTPNGSQGSDTCIPQCIGSMKKPEQAKFIAASGCLDGGGPDQKACQKSLLACIAPDGQKNCGEGFMCIQDCSKSSTPSLGCLFGCIKDTDAKDEAEQLWSTLDSCEGSFMGPGAGPAPMPAPPTATGLPNGTTPTEDACGKATIACLAKGTANCSDTAKCVNACTNNTSGSDDTTCTLKCLMAATPEAATKIDAYNTCEEACNKKCAGAPSTCQDTCTGCTLSDSPCD